MKPIIPENKTGIQSNVEEEITLKSRQEALEKYNEIRKRLLNVNDWQKIAGNGSSEFRVFDEQGNPYNGPVRVGNYFRIDIPGPGPATGDGYDWVRVEAVEETGDA